MYMLFCWQYDLLKDKTKNNYLWIEFLQSYSTSVTLFQSKLALNNCGLSVMWSKINNSSLFFFSKANTTKSQYDYPFVQNVLNNKMYLSKLTKLFCEVKKKINNKNINSNKSINSNYQNWWVTLGWCTNKLVNKHWISEMKLTNKLTCFKYQPCNYY